MKSLKLFSIGFLVILGSTIVNAQCVEINCPGDQIFNAALGTCEVEVDYEIPTAIDYCILEDTTTLSYDFTGDVQEFIVPENVSLISFQVAGAEGGISAVDFSIQDTTQFPGLGGLITGDLEVEPGQILYIYVGGKGGNGADGSGGAGGYNGGANGNFGTSFSGGGGGGATDIRLNGTELEDRIIVAGGGGGSAVNFIEDGGDNGGHGGDLVGQNGFTGDVNGDFPEIIVATGGTQTEGGNGAEYEPHNPGFDGTFGIGGMGGFGTSGGGGGGGYYGGGGGAWTGGAGGSSFSSGAVNVGHAQGANEADGYVILSYTLDAELEVQLEEGLGSGELFPIGVTEETWTTMDSMGNTISCSFLITVNPPIYPVTVAGSTLSSDELADTYQWINCEDNSLIDGATNQDYTASELGEYAVILTHGTCLDTTDCYEVLIIGIEDQLLIQALEIYPNPTTDIVNISIEGNQSEVYIQLFSADGREILNEKRSPAQLMELDLGSFESGLYLLNVSIGDRVNSVWVGKE